MFDAGYNQVLKTILYQYLVLPFKCSEPWTKFEEAGGSMKFNLVNNGDLVFIEIIESEFMSYFELFAGACIAD